MRRFTRAVTHFPSILLVVFAGVLVTTLACGDGRGRVAAPVDQGVFQLPMAFEPNVGQTHSDVRYLARGSGYTTFLTPREIVLSLGRGTGAGHQPTSVRDAVVRIRLAGASPGSLEPGPVLPGRVNYLRGRDPRQWRTDLPTHASVTYRDAYPGIDAVFYGSPTDLEYDFIVSPGADPRAVALALADLTGAPIPVKLDGAGDLLLLGEADGARMNRPRVYQDIAGVRREVEGAFVLDASAAETRVRFAVGEYDTSRPLVIDPVLSYSSFLGGSGGESVGDPVVDASGNIYLTGRTTSTDFPVVNPLLPPGTLEAFVSKINASGTALVYSTYLGGAGFTTGRAIAVDGAGQAYVTGETSASNFPVVAPFQPNLAGGSVGDVFVTKLNASGSAIVYSTYLGGSGQDLGFAIHVDAAGAAYVAGCTTSTNFPTLNAAQPGIGAPDNTQYCADAFVTKFAPGGSTLAYSTYLGGSGTDLAGDITVDANGRAIVTGETQSANFPITTNVSQPTRRGTKDAFVTALQANGQAWRYSTYLGSAGSDTAEGVTMSPDGHVLVTGTAAASDFPNSGTGVAQSTFGGAGDAFLVKMDNTTSLTKILYATFLGGSGLDIGRGVSADSAGNVYVAGSTASPNFPTVRAFQSSGVGTSAFVAKLRAEPGPFLYSSYLDGTFDDQATGVASTTSGAVIVAGVTSSADFPVVGGFQSTYAGGQDAFVTNVQARSDVRITMTDAPDPVAVNGTLTYTMTVTNLGPDVATGVRVTDTIPSGTTFVSVTTSQGSCSGTTTVTCTLGVVDSAAATITLRVRPTTAGSKSNTATVSRHEQDPVSTNNSATATTTVGYPLTVSVVRLSGASGSVSSVPAGISCGSDCTETYASGTSVRLAAAPGGSSEFQGWSGACTGTGSCIVSMTGSRSVTATFRLAQ